MTRFRIQHTTEYRYPGSAMESHAELRVWPRDTAAQKVRMKRLRISPNTKADHYVDYFGNHVASFSIPSRHSRLAVTASCEVEVEPSEIPVASLEVPVAEARQIFGGHRIEHFDWRSPTDLVPIGTPFLKYAREFLPPQKPIGQALQDLNHFIFTRFQYKFGITDVSTSAAEVARRKRGVCQDFAHFMLGVLRTAYLPCRYVSGYIETAQAKAASEAGRPNLIGSAASHAWIEALLPGEIWIGLDPTNDLVVADRHVTISVGRDFNDVTPLRGAYRGPKSGRPNVKVRVRRL